MAGPGLPEEQLHKILQQIQAQVISSQRQLNLVRAQVTSKEREQKMHALTRKQVEDEQSGKTGPFYRAVGKMFISEDPKILTAEMAKKEKEAADEIANLVKKQKFLEKQFTESQGHLRDIFKSQEQAQKAAAA